MAAEARRRAYFRFGIRVPSARIQFVPAAATLESRAPERGSSDPQRYQTRGRSNAEHGASPRLWQQWRERAMFAIRISRSAIVFPDHHELRVEILPVVQTFRFPCLVERSLAERLERVVFTAAVSLRPLISVPPIVSLKNASGIGVDDKAGMLASV